MACVAGTCGCSAVAMTSSSRTGWSVDGLLATVNRLTPWASRVVSEVATRCGRIVDVVLPSNWLDRYRRGQRGHVWHELRQLGGAVRESGLCEEAQLVCDEMAGRARENVEVIVERLSSEGYRFHLNDDAQTSTTPYVPPGGRGRRTCRLAGGTLRPVPMTVLSWVRLVGDVWRSARTVVGHIR
jgi:hypothetical protein